MSDWFRRALAGADAVQLHGLRFFRSRARGPMWRRERVRLDDAVGERCACGIRGGNTLARSAFAGASASSRTPNARALRLVGAARSRALSAIVELVAAEATPRRQRVK